jgi:hypothetical protein
VPARRWNDPAQAAQERDGLEHELGASGHGRWSRYANAAVVDPREPVLRGVNRSSASRS